MQGNDYIKVLEKNNYTLDGKDYVKQWKSNLIGTVITKVSLKNNGFCVGCMSNEGTIVTWSFSYNSPFLASIQLVEYSLQVDFLKP